MKKEFLNLIPKRFLCPYCGEWHEWEEPHELGYYIFDTNWLGTKGIRREVKLFCTNIKGNRVSFSKRGDALSYEIPSICRYSYYPIEGTIPISSIVENRDKPIVAFDVAYTTSQEVGTNYCGECKNQKHCNFKKLGDEADNQHNTINLGFEFEQSQYREVQVMTELGQNKDDNIISTSMGIAVKNGDSYRIYDNKKMKSIDIANMQIDNLTIFNFLSTKLNDGDLIKDNGEYYFVMKSENGTNNFLYAKTGELKTVVPFKNALGFSCYSKVIALNAEKMTIMYAMCGQSGNDNGQINQLLSYVLQKDKLGDNDDMINMMLMSSTMSFLENGYHKITDQNAGMNRLLPLLFFKDTLGVDNNMMTKRLMTYMMPALEKGDHKIIGQNIGVNQLLSLLLFKDNLDVDDDMVKNIFIAYMMSVPAKGDHKIIDQNTGMNQLLPLLLFKDKFDVDDDMMKMILMAFMMSGGNMAGNNNPVIAYFMLDKFLNKNKD